MRMDGESSDDCVHSIETRRSITPTLLCFPHRLVGDEERPHHQLTTVAQKTRGAVAKSMDRSYFHMRYGKGAWAPSQRVKPHYVHDVALMMHPSFARLDYVDAIVGVLGGSRGMLAVGSPQRRQMP